VAGGPDVDAVEEAGEEESADRDGLLTPGGGGCGEVEGVGAGEVRESAAGGGGSVLCGGAGCAGCCTAVPRNLRQRA